MAGPTPRTATVLVLVIIASAGMFPIAAGQTATAEEPETAEEYFETFRALEGSPTIQEYDELETVRTFAVTEIQEVGTLQTADQERFGAILELLETFEEADEAAAEGDYEAALDTGERLEAAIGDLEAHGEGQAVLADIAASRFYEDLSDELRSTAEDSDRTDDEIENLSMAATASERADFIGEAAELRLQVEQRTAELERDEDQIAETMERAEAFSEECVDCADEVDALTGNGIGLFQEYQEARELAVELSDAEDRAALHGLEDREENLSAAALELEEQQTTLAITTAGILVGYGLVFGLVGSIVFTRVFAWKRAYRRATVDNVVQVGGNR